MQAYRFVYAEVLEQGYRQDVSASIYSLHTLLAQLHVVPDLPACNMLN